MAQLLTAIKEIPAEVLTPELLKRYLILLLRKIALKRGKNSFRIYHGQRNIFG
jgi:hypothetical protein